MSEHMRNDKKRWLLGAGLALGLGVGAGCLDFQKAYQEALDDCVKQGKCEPPADGGCNVDYPDPPDDRFADTNCDGLDGLAVGPLFVDTASGDDNSRNVGTKEAPYKTLRAALQQAAQSNKPIYLARGDYAEELNLDRPVSIYGGYARIDGQWTRGPQYEARLIMPGIGLTVTNLGTDAGILLDYFSIASTTVADAGGVASIGLKVVNSTGVRLRNMDVVAGPGGTGRSAPLVLGARAGGMGVGGGSPSAQATSEAQGGAAGANPCDPTQVKGRGGQGGGRTYQAQAGEANGDTVRGGAAGTYGCNGGLECPTGNAGENGQDGRPGRAGEPGREGDGLGSMTATGVWVAQSGEQGLGPGDAGLNGGGGGGGARAGDSSAYSLGGGGGGGGGGGCGGQPGLGGQGGGASIGVLILNGQVSLEGTSRVRTLGGGQGGKGALGGEGGAGGAGGTGGKSPQVTNLQGVVVQGGDGGTGGTGGKGGNGGNGGGGGGGPSIGLWCLGDASFSREPTSSILPGDGGTSGARDQVTGNDGVREDFHGCPPP